MSPPTLQPTRRTPRSVGGPRPQRVRTDAPPQTVRCLENLESPDRPRSLQSPRTFRSPVDRGSVARPDRGDRGDRDDRAFTLLELLIVIAIIGLLAALTVPSLKNAQKSNALASASQQLIDDIAYARRVAIKDRTTVLMVFLPAANAADAATYSALNTGEKNVLLRGQQTSYALFSTRQVGDQPGDPHPRFLRNWQYLPAGYFFPSWKFDPAISPTRIDATNSRERSPVDVHPFPWTERPNAVPVPTLLSPRRVYVSLPYIAFGPNGGLQTNNTAGDFFPANSDEYIPLARGPIFPARNATDDKQLLWEPADIAERPPQNSIDNYHLIVIDKLTGRTRVAKPEISP